MTTIIAAGKYGSLCLYCYPAPGQEVLLAQIYYEGLPGMTAEIAHLMLDEVQATFEGCQRLPHSER